jgi:hypothetical protein
MSSYLLTARADQEIQALRAQVKKPRKLRRRDRAEIEGLKAAWAEWIEWAEAEWFSAQLAPPPLDDEEPEDRPGL